MMLFVAFLLASLFLFLQTTLLPHFVLLAYAPWLALIILYCKLPKCLYLSFLSGAIMDLLTDDPMGVHAVNYTMISLLLYRYQRYFLYSMPLHLTVFTFLVSFCSTFLQLFLLFLFDRRVPFTGQWALGDLLLMPIADALYALVWFAYPLKVYNQGILFWRNIKKRLFPTSH